MPSYPIWLATTLTCCFGAQMIALWSVGGRTAKSESNYFSSIGRIQAGTRGEPEIMILGSSITGRLPDRTQGIAGVANMGCDGGSAVDSLRAMDAGILPSAPWIVIEANTLQVALEKKPSEIGGAMRRPWFRAGMEISVLGAYARPAAFFYSKLLANRIGGFQDHRSSDDLGVVSRPTEITAKPEGTILADQENLIVEISAILKRLQGKGSRTLIVWLPPGRKPAPEAPPWILELARRSGAAWWDLGQEALPETVSLTDGVHMSTASAERTVVSLLKGIDKQSGR